MQKAIDDARDELGDKARPWHGQCGEIHCAQQMYDLGLYPSKSEMVSFNLNGAQSAPGTIRPPCASCRVIMPKIGVEPRRK